MEFRALHKTCVHVDMWTRLKQARTTIMKILTLQHEQLELFRHPKHIYAGGLGRPCLKFGRVSWSSSFSS